MPSVFLYMRGGEPHQGMFLERAPNLEVPGYELKHRALEGWGYLWPVETGKRGSRNTYVKHRRSLMLVWKVSAGVRVRPSALPTMILGISERDAVVPLDPDEVAAVYANLLVYWGAAPAPSPKQRRRDLLHIEADNRGRLVYLGPMRNNGAALAPVPEPIVLTTETPDRFLVLDEEQVRQLAADLAAIVDRWD